MTSWNLRFVIVVFVLGGTALFLHSHANTPITPKAISPASLPFKVGDWIGRDIPIAAQALRALHGAKLLQRAYYRPRGLEPEVYLYMAYHLGQPAGYRPHLPEDCLEGSGWSVLETATITVSLAGQRSFPANRLLIAKGGDRQLLLYWFWARGRRVASEQWADAYLILDSLRFNRSDDALIRINTPVSAHEGASVAERRLLSFATQVVPAMDSYLPQ